MAHVRRQTLPKSRTHRPRTRSLALVRLRPRHPAALTCQRTWHISPSSQSPNTRDIYLNDIAYWKNIPANVWNYYIGGYQVIKKWLSYREKKILGRAMKMEEVEYVTEMARRLAAIVLLQPKLDENYRTVKSNTYPWPAP